MAARVVQEMGKSRAAAFAVGLQDIDEGAHVNSFAETADSHDSDTNENSHSEGNFFSLLSGSCLGWCHLWYMLESNCDVLISTMLNCVGLAKVVYGGLGCLVSSK